MALLTEPSFQHGQPSRVGILLVNLGTPAAPTAAAVRRYLAQFLADPRVVEIPRLIWWPILHGIILRVRPQKSAAKYASIWTPDGSPLRYHTEQQARYLRGYLGERGIQVEVAHAMRYGDPSIADVWQQLRQQGCDRILLMPLYPQYAGSTTATAVDEVARLLLRTRNQPALRIVKHYHDDPGYIDALAAHIRQYWQQRGRAEKLVMSFHGVPKRTLLRGDPYHCECHKTARLLAERLGLSKAEYVVTFQSRFGKAEWLQPYTEPTVISLAQQGVKNIQVICPGFVSDCLETLEEIALEVKQAFLDAGGKDFAYIPCLNDNPAWLNALADICQRHLQGWDTGAPDMAALSTQRTAALELGASD
ncbi:ferrochelatase [Parvibium lacunae]|uniref:Ferrochelatase n=1 Tax=Parvibium lacunae TaxID=1888893 RepID=A0A368L453_9BURK|nr:ferrochelatase [Parvibium lacunae]RCS58347.1 ferrochelatase [Parvibium lacunae]